MKYALSVKQSLLFTDLSLIGTRKKFNFISLGLDYEPELFLIRDNDIFWNYDDDIVFNRVFLEKTTLNEAVDSFNKSLAKTTNNLEEVSDKIISSGELTPGDKKRLESLFEKYLEAYLLNMPFLFNYWNVEHLIVNQLTRDFAIIFGEREKEKNLQKVLLPAKATYFARERQSLEEISLFVLRHKNIMSLFQNPDVSQIENKLSRYSKLKNKIERHIKIFGFTSFALQLGMPLNNKDILERVAEEIKNNLNKKINSKRRQFKKDVQERNQILVQLLPFEDIAKRVILAQELMYWKNQRLDVLFKCDLKVKPLYDAIAELMGISYDKFVYLRYEEIKRWFQTGKMPHVKEINQRIKSFALQLKNGKITLFINANNYPKVDKVIIEDNLNSDSTNIVLKGKSAYGGNVTGRVKVVLKVEDIKKVEKGDILVASMTRPEMIVGLEKAAGFVTDQGGMLSHAAIVSREMRKSCIVGTKNASKILKDGDLMEVDADAGVVRVLERS